MKAVAMKNIEGQGYQECEAAEATHVRLCLPGPVGTVVLPVMLGNKSRAGTGCWSWNGDVDKPTLKPSLLVKGTHKLRDADYERVMAGCKVTPKPYRCHSFISNGQVRFLDDSTHPLKGKTVDLLDAE